MIFIIITIQQFNLFTTSIINNWYKTFFRRWFARCTIFVRVNVIYQFDHQIQNIVDYHYYYNSTIQLIYNICPSRRCISYLSCFALYIKKNEKEIIFWPNLDKCSKKQFPLGYHRSLIRRCKTQFSCCSCWFLKYSAIIIPTGKRFSSILMRQIWT